MINSPRRMMMMKRKKDDETDETEKNFSKMVLIQKYQHQLL